MPDPSPRPEPDPSAIRNTGQLMSRARRALAYGGLDGVIQRPLFADDGTLFPQFAVEAEGCTLIDSTGRRYIDWTNGWGPVMLGYRHPAVEEAIQRQLAAGPTLSLMHPIEIELAERLIDWIPCAEMVAFGKNGSDMVTAAVRLAKAITGRDLILQFGFHGFHDWYTCQSPEVQGIPKVLRDFVIPFPYNDLKVLGRLLKKHAGQVAGVIMEPVNMYRPVQGYLEGVRELTRQHGALLIFDEIVTGFRFHCGGAQGLYGVTPDLATFGKGLANGMPISALAGKREYMQSLPSVGVGMTFRGETLSMAAAHAVLDVLSDVDLPAHLRLVGERVRTGFHEACEQTGIQCRLTGHPARQTFEFNDQDGLSVESIRHEFLLECLKRGVLTNGNLLPSLAIDTAAVDRTLEVFREALAVVRDAMSGVKARDARPHGGFPFGPRARTFKGFVETLDDHAEGLHVGGWGLLAEGPPQTVLAVSRDGTRIEGSSVDRPDLGEAYPHLGDARRGGFQITLPRGEFLRGDEYEFTLRFDRPGAVPFRCHVVRRVDGSEAPGGPFPIGDGVLYV